MPSLLLLKLMKKDRVELKFACDEECAKDMDKRDRSKCGMTRARAQNVRVAIRLDWQEQGKDDVVMQSKDESLESGKAAFPRRGCAAIRRHQGTLQ